MFFKKLIFFITTSVIMSSIFNTSFLICQTIIEFSKSQTNIIDPDFKEKESLIKGEEYFFKKSFTVAEIFFKKVIEINPENFIAHSYLGEIYLYFKKLEEAIYHFQIAVELQKNQKHHFPEKEYFRLAQANYLKKDKEKTKFYCEQILKKNQNFYPCYYYLGMIAIEYEKNRGSALIHFQKYLELLETSKLSYTSDYEEEKEKIKQLFVVLSDSNYKNNDSITLKQELDPLNLFNKNQTLILKPPLLKPKEKEKFDFTLPSEKKFDDKWIEIQQIWKSDKRKAIEILYQYKNSSELKSANENYLIRKFLCSVFLELKDYETAEKECKEATYFDYDSQLLYYLSMIYYKKKDKEFFEKYIKKYLEIQKYDFDTYFMLAHYYYEEKKYSDALQYFEKILTLQNNHKESLYYVFQIYKELDKPKKMIEVYEKIEIYYPEEYELQRTLVFDLLEKNQEEVVIDFLEKIYKKTKEKYDGLILCGLYLRKENKSKAKEILIELYQLYPEDWEVVKAVILFFKEEETNYDSIEIIVKQFLKNVPIEKKEEVLKILPDSIRQKIVGSDQKQD